MKKTAMTVCVLAMSLPIHAADLPKREAGLWVMKTQMQAQGGEAAAFSGIRQQFSICVGPDEDRFLDEGKADNCRPQTLRREGARLIVESECTIEGSQAKARGEFTGSLTRDYKGEIHTRYTPPLHGMSESRMWIEGQHQGPCAPGQAPGQMTGIKMEGAKGEPMLDLQNLGAGQKPDPEKLLELQKLFEQMKSGQ
jgi:hypothetical protein